MRFSSRGRLGGSAFYPTVRSERRHTRFRRFFQYFVACIVNFRQTFGLRLCETFASPLSSFEMLARLVRRLGGRYYFRVVALVFVTTNKLASD